MTRKVRNIFLVMGIVGFGLSWNTRIGSAQEIPTAAEVFPKDEIQKIQSKIQNQTIQEDEKEKSTGTISLYSTSTDGKYPTRKGIILVTNEKYKGVIPSGHAAIVYSKKRVIESVEKGVVVGNNDWNKSTRVCYGEGVLDTTYKQDVKAADWCHDQVGKPYNYDFYDIGNRSKFYCSQLVWAAFYDNYAINISTTSFGIAIHPSELVASNETKTVYMGGTEFGHK